MTARSSRRSFPELWMFARYSSHLAGEISELKEEDLTIVSKVD